MSKLKELIRAKSLANDAYCEAYNLLDEERRKRIAAATAKIDADMKADRDEVTKLCVILNEADSAIVAELDRVATIAKDAPHPLGTKLDEWKRGDWWNKEPEMFPTGRSGILEVVTSKTPFPSNLEWGKPIAGEYIVRLIKKDGKTGLAFKRFYEEEWRLPSVAEAGVKP